VENYSGNGGKQFPDGRQTGENIAEYLQKLLQTTLAGVNVVGFVGDNASSLQLGFSVVQRAAAAGDLAEQFEDNERTMEFGVFDTAGKVNRDDVRAAQIPSWFPGSISGCGASRTPSNSW
jgi:hypothetical protein